MAAAKPEVLALADRDRVAGDSRPIPSRSRIARACAAAVACALLLAAPGRGRGDVRQPILAGSWYPGDAAELRKAVEAYLGPPAAVELPPSALIAPHAGYQFSGATAGKAFASVRGRSYDRVVLLGPSHRLAFSGAALPEHSAWRTPLGETPLDQNALASLAGRRGFQRLPAAHAKEHSLEIELPFLQVALAPGFKLVPIVIGRLDEETLASIGEAVEALLGPRALLVVSSDFTHFGPNYGYTPFRDDIPRRIHDLDNDAIGAIGRLSPTEFDDYLSRTGVTICGAEPIRVLLGMYSGKPVRASTLGYARSGDLMGDFTNSVSYVAMAFATADEAAGGGTIREPAGGSTPGRPRMLSEKEQAFLLDLARRTIGAALRGSDAPPARVPDEFGEDSPLHEQRGVFVTLTDSGDLRGCIGNIVGTEPLVRGVAHQAINAAFHDPRFPALRPDELAEIEVEISVLTPPVPVPGYDAIEVGRHGVLLEKDGRRAVFLPQVAPEQGWDRETMLRHLCRKAGLGSEEWRSGTQFEVFEAQVFEEKHSR